MEKKYISVLVFILIMACLFICTYKKTEQNESSLINNKKLTIGEITKVEFFPRGDGIRVWYTYNSPSHKDYKSAYHLYIDSRRLADVERMLKGRHLPTIYDSNDIGNSYLLLTSRDFERYSVRQPDSLKDLNQELLQLQQ